MNKWWGYRHINDTLQVKRFFSWQDMEEAEDSDMVKITAGPFEAKDRMDALNKLKENLWMKN